MKTKTFLSALLLAAGAALSGSALAQWHEGGHVRFGINFGVPLYAPYYSPYYYPPYPAPYYPPVVVQQAPITYVQQAPSGPSTAPPDWYYCAESKVYYPYVKQCPGGWQRVPARPHG